MAGPVIVELEAANPLSRPISFVKELKRLGMNLREAHQVLNDLKAGKRARVQIRVRDLAEAADILRPYEVAIVSDGHSPKA